MVTLKPTRQSFCSQLLHFILCCYVFFVLNQELGMRKPPYMVWWLGQGGSGAVNSQTGVSWHPSLCLRV